jgi:hypothetical protein
MLRAYARVTADVRRDEGPPRAVLRHDFRPEGGQRKGPGVAFDPVRPVLFQSKEKLLRVDLSVAHAERAKVLAKRAVRHGEDGFRIGFPPQPIAKSAQPPGRRNRPSRRVTGVGRVRVGL